MMVDIRASGPKQQGAEYLAGYHGQGDARLIQSSATARSPVRRKECDQYY